MHASAPQGLAWLSSFPLMAHSSADAKTSPLIYENGKKQPGGERWKSWKCITCMLLWYSTDGPPMLHLIINFVFSGCTSEGALLLLAPFEGAGKAKKQDKSHICTSTISAALLWISACVDADRTRSRDTFPLTNSGPFCFASPLCIPIVPFP